MRGKKKSVAVKRGGRERWRKCVGVCVNIVTGHVTSPKIQLKKIRKEKKNFSHFLITMTQMQFSILSSIIIM